MVRLRHVGASVSKTLIIAVAIPLTIGSMASAQTPPPAPQATPAPRFAMPHSEEDAALSGPERVARTSANLERMRGVLKTLLKYLVEARDKHDFIKLNCINEKLTAVKGLLKVSEQADIGMQEAIARRDEETSLDQYEKVSVARGKVDQLLTETESCVGELSVYAGSTTVEVTSGDNTQVPPPPPPASTDIVVRPPAASNGEGG